MSFSSLEPRASSTGSAPVQVLVPAVRYSGGIPRVVQGGIQEGIPTMVHTGKYTPTMGGIHHPAVHTHHGRHVQHPEVHTMGGMYNTLRYTSLLRLFPGYHPEVYLSPKVIPRYIPP